MVSLLYHVHDYLACVHNCIPATCRASGVDLGGGCKGCALPFPRDDLWLSNTTGILQKNLLYHLIWFSAVHIMLLPSQKPSSSNSLLKFVDVTSQLSHSLVVHHLLRKIPDPPLSMFNKDFTRFMLSFSCTPKLSKQKKHSAGRVRKSLVGYF